MSSAQTERLESLLQSESAADRSQIRSGLARLSSEIKERANRGASDSYDYFVGALRLLSRFRGSANADLRIECLADCVSYFYHASYSTKALESAKLLLTLAASTGDLGQIRKGHTYLAAIYADAGDVGEALIHDSRALDLSRQIGDVVAEVRVLTNTGVALNYAGLYREAVSCFRRGAEICPPSEVQLKAGCLINIAQSHLYLQEFREGYESAASALASTPEPTDAASTVSYVIRSLTFVQLALEMGKLNAARQQARACAQRVPRITSPRAHALADTARGLCEVHGGDPARGLAILEENLAKSIDHGTRLLILTALVKAYDVACMPEQALIHMHSLLEHVRATRERALAGLSDGHGDAGTSLQGLELREARLEARVAEREVLAERHQMFERLATAADLKEEQSGEHGYRVGRLSAILARNLRWSVEAMNAIEFAARLHDIGKIAIPDRILLCSKDLRDAERRFMSTHTTFGAELLGRGNSAELRMAEEIARHHHEWWNGEGYPSKLKGKRIPIHARIVAIADVFDALTHGRPFSPPWPIDKAIDEIRSRKGTQFDPEITDVFLELIDKLRSEHADLDEYLGRAGRNSPFLQARNRIRQMLAEERDHEKMTTAEGNETRH